jgi:hypothetical protein
MHHPHAPSSWLPQDMWLHHARPHHTNALRMPHAMPRGPPDTVGIFLLPCAFAANPHLACVRRALCMQHTTMNETRSHCFDGCRLQEGSLSALPRADAAPGAAPKHEATESFTMHSIDESLGSMQPVMTAVNNPQLRQQSTTTCHRTCQYGCTQNLLTATSQ